MKIKAIILTLLVFSLIFLVACQEGKTSDTGDKTTTGEKTTEKTEEGSSFLDIIGKKTNEYKATYNIKTTSEGKTTSYTMMWAVKGKDKVKWSMDVPEQKSSAVFYKVGTEFYMCSTTDGKEMCFKTQQNVPDFDSNLESYKDTSKYSTSAKAPKVIAGATALCFEIKGMGTDAQSYEVESCISKEGVPLYMKSSFDKGTTTMEATEFSTSVVDSEFNIPENAQVLTALTQ